MGGILLYAFSLDTILGLFAHFIDDHEATLKRLLDANLELIVTKVMTAVDSRLQQSRDQDRASSNSSNASSPSRGVKTARIKELRNMEGHPKYDHARVIRPICDNSNGL